MPDFLSWLENSSWASLIRQSLWMYPALEIIHIIGIVLLVGGALLFDFRLLGSSKNLPLSDISGHLLPWSRRGLILVIPSGLFLFITNAETLGVDPTFWLKMIMLIVGGLNALIFHKLVYKRQTDSKVSSGNSRYFKISALISIAVWITVITCGRLLAY